MGLISKDPKKGIGGKAAREGKDWVTGMPADTTGKTIFGGRMTAHSSWHGKDDGKKSK